MLLKVRLPTSIPQIPRMQMPPLPLSMSDVDLTLSILPSASTILLSLLASFILTSFVRALWIGMQERLALVKKKRHEQHHHSPSRSLVPPPEKPTVSPAKETRRPTSSWLWGLIRSDILPSFPTRGSNSTSAAVDLNEKQTWSQPQPRRPPMMTQVGRRAGPAFDRPLPTLYESDIPVSMAKIIMSRHVSSLFLSVSNAFLLPLSNRAPHDTFRRPTSRPPPVRSSSTVQVQRRVSRPAQSPSLVIPAPSSSLSRPTSPPSRSPSPTSPSSSSSRSNSRSPSPPRSPPRSPPLVSSTIDLPPRSSGSIV
ncbi:hypothetical protein FA15DRAFT_357936 [Coprinopsis marcescibilis]|uniref:Uncharacterized protein n=1 Tax=Coprinopsis marcescibilis TaxID=230819 RepID=A0A5C3KYT2_COPMA|nr:hypothetical protein FA15DRAFT_357936 [Coprinopsis marcescibilis]